SVAYLKSQVASESLDVSYATQCAVGRFARPELQRNRHRLCLRIATRQGDFCPWIHKERTLLEARKYCRCRREGREKPDVFLDSWSAASPETAGMLPRGRPRFETWHPFSS